MTDSTPTPEELLQRKGASFRDPEGPVSGVEPPQYSDEAVALAFSAEQDGRLLYVPELRHWLYWDGRRWVQDTTLVVIDTARAICRRHAARADAQAKGASWVSNVASAHKVAAVERLARADRRHTREAAIFDADPWILNTPKGVVDLRSGRTRMSRHTDLLTKMTSVAPGDDCPRWHAFLWEILQGDAEAIAYLQRWVGYILTGDTREHAFLFAVGPGGNGKTVLFSIIAEMLGDYATTAPMETFMVSHNDRHPTDLAGLRGARFVLAQETEAKHILAESRIKTLTGGDRVSALFMRGDFFEFQPIFKLAMVGNHRPTIRNPGEAMRRRLHLLPITFKPSVPDTGLSDALRVELPGILAWAIEGCQMWQRDGLGMPRVVKDATSDYFAEQDLLAQWIAERCEAQRGASTPSSALFRDWKAWIEARGEQADTNMAFSAALEQHFTERRTGKGVMFIGIRLLPSPLGVF
jgi:putative DNA primase/helicase